MESWLKLLDLVPLPLWAALACWAVSAGATESARRQLPDGLSPRRRSAALQGTAILSSVLLAWLLIGGRWGFALGLSVGFWSVGAYYIALAVARWKFPRAFDFIDWQQPPPKIGSKP